MPHSTISKVFIVFGSGSTDSTTTGSTGLTSSTTILFCLIDRFGFGLIASSTGGSSTGSSIDSMGWTTLFFLLNLFHIYILVSLYQYNLIL